MLEGEIMPEVLCIKPSRPEGEFFRGRREETKKIGIEILGVCSQLEDPNFGYDRKGEIADFLSVPIERVVYVARILREEGYIYSNRGQIIAYYLPEVKEEANE